MVTLLHCDIQDFIDSNIYPYSFDDGSCLEALWDVRDKKRYYGILRVIQI